MLTAPSDSAVPATVDLGPVATVELTLGGMHCNACATRIEKALGEQHAVLSASVNLATNRAFVTYDATEATTDDLCAMVSTVGYSATMAPKNAVVRPQHDPDHWGLRALVSWPTALLALGVALLAPETAFSGWVVLSLAVVVEGAGGWPFLRTSARLLRHGGTSMDTLITVGTLAALAVDRGGGDRPRWSARPHRGWRRLRGPTARCHGPSHRGHPRHRPRRRGPGPSPSRRSLALVDGVAAAHRPGGG